MDLNARDRNAVQYSKSVLDQGDTLIVIKYPNDQPAYDATGFPLQTLHRVHSENLLATDSEYFKFRLNSQWHNHRAAKKAGAFPGLPEGIKYVIDMTPPEEGDDALQITADLSCSAGIRKWHTASSRLNVSKALVGGKDETTTIPRKRDSVNLPTSPIKSEGSNEPKISELSTAATSIINGETAGSSYTGVLPEVKSCGGTTGRHYAFGENLDGGSVDEKLSQEEIFSTLSDAKYSEESDEEVLDYCPIRHRAGIERLLQIIEGKDPRLDSAPKVWTLAVLGKYFDCTHTVVDYIMKWVIAEPNSRFMEILPEATLKMGLTLQNSHLTRSAYSVLVSEEALRVGTGKYFREFVASQEKKNPFFKATTRFCRAREDLDEDILNSIQHAGRHFNSRIEKALGELLHPEMNWLLIIPEFDKVVVFEAYLDAMMKPGSSEVLRKKKIIHQLIDGLRSYVRGRVLSCLLSNLSNQQSKIGNDHRAAEHWTGPGPQPYGFVYNTLSDHERMVTRGFWEILRNLEWSTVGLDVYSNQIRDNLTRTNPYYQRNDEIADSHGINLVTMRQLENHEYELNNSIIVTIQIGGFHGGKVPGVASRPFSSAQSIVHSLTGTARSVVDGLTEKFANLPSGNSSSAQLLSGNSSFTNESLDEFWTSQETVENKVPKVSLPVEDALPENRENNDDSPLFSLPIFLKQVGKKIRSVCADMLNRGENDWSVLCDTLLSLTDEEYKFLPLWAGGLDDGSGGVFEEEIPSAEKGPIGPGPAFHTGSTVNSVVDSDFDFDGRSSTFDTATIEGIQTSLGVEDGYSDHLDRRAVYSEEDFPMEHAALPVDSHTRDGHTSGFGGTLGGSHVEGGQPAGNGQAQVGHTSGGSQGTLTGSAHIDGDDFFIVEDEDEDLDMDSDGTLTETE